MDISPERLDFVREKIGADHVVNSMEDPIGKVSEITHSDLATTVFDATGNRTALETGVKYLAHGGTYVLVGLSKGELTFVHPEIHAKETSLLCSRNATIGDFERVISLMPDFPTTAYVTDRVPFESVISEIDNWINPEYGTIKAMLTL